VVCALALLPAAGCSSVATTATAMKCKKDAEPVVEYKMECREEDKEEDKE
jgi:hypothetical protein